MTFRFRVGLRLASALLVFPFLAAASAQAPKADPLIWQDAEIAPGLVLDLEAWLDVHSAYSRHPDAPRIRWIDAKSAKAMSGSSSSLRSGTPRGLYDANTRTIWLVRPWSPRNPHDVSVLLHELVHHRQASAGHWYCAEAQELPAYKLQKKWLAARALEINVNWIAVVLDSACSPRDIHPD